VRIGVDSYSYHRLLGEIRPGEEDPGERLPDGGAAVVQEARRLGLDGVSLETCYLDPPAALALDPLRAAAGGMELVLAWGAPNGLELGASEAGLRDLLEWIDVAASLQCRTMRIVVAGPTLRYRVADELENAVPPLRTASSKARSLDLDLALENHGDLTAREISELLAAVGDPALRVCFDTANALRVGDDPLEAARLLAPAVAMAHLKDCEPLDPDADPVAGPRSVPYGTGVIPLEAILRLIPAEALVCIEIAQLGPGADERALVADSVGWLRARVRHTSDITGGAR
jgi:sugar phosphate isomerase/epimerase